MAEDCNDSSDDEYFDCIEDLKEKYFAVAVPKDRGDGMVFSNMLAASRKLREVKGSRLKIFNSQQAAKLFAKTPAETLYSPQPKEKTKLRKNVDPFPNVTQRDLNDFRMAIEKGKSDQVQKMIWNNPRHLVNESDSPTILQVRFRYNALHSAAAHGQAGLISYLLGVMDDLEFWRSLYPTADTPVNMERREHVLDMYLNAPETGNMETPLHFACKFGHVDSVRALVSHRLTQHNPKNREGHTPHQVICTRFNPVTVSKVWSPFSNSEMDDPRQTVVDQITHALSESYVVLIDSNDGLSARVLEPMSWPQLSAHLSSRPLTPSTSPTRPHTLLATPSRLSRLDDPPLSPVVSTGTTQNHSLLTSGRLRAFAGPLSPQKAETFYREWCTPTRVKRDKFAQMKLTDGDKGFERMGRHLAKQYKTQWKEYWDFLDDFVDLSTNEGLQQLEKYLEKVPETPANLLNGPIQCNILDDNINNTSPVKPIPCRTVEDEEEEFSDAQDSFEIISLPSDGIESVLNNKIGANLRTSENRSGIFSAWRYRDPTPTTLDVDYDIDDNSEEFERNELDTSPNALHNDSVNSSGGMLSSLTRMFSNLALISPIRWTSSPVSPTAPRNKTPPPTTPTTSRFRSPPHLSASHQCIGLEALRDDSPVVTSSVSRTSDTAAPFLSLTSTPRRVTSTPHRRLRRSIGAGCSGQLTKVDINALRAIVDMVPNDDLSRYPTVHQWYDEVRPHDTSASMPFTEPIRSPVVRDSGRSRRSIASPFVLNARTQYQLNKNRHSVSLSTCEHSSR